MGEFLRQLALAVAPTVAGKLLDVAIEERRARAERQRAADPTSLAAYIARSRG